MSLVRRCHDSDMLIHERRKHPRLLWNAPVRITNPETRESWSARSIDLSRGGVLIDSALPLGPGEEVKIDVDIGKFTLPQMRARVCRTHSAFWGRRHLSALSFEESGQALVDAARHELNKSLWSSAS